MLRNWGSKKLRLGWNITCGKALSNTEPSNRRCICKGTPQIKGLHQDTGRDWKQPSWSLSLRLWLPQSSKFLRLLWSRLASSGAGASLGRVGGRLWPGIQCGSCAELHGGCWGTFPLFLLLNCSISTCKTSELPNFCSVIWTQLFPGVSDCPSVHWSDT